MTSIRELALAERVRTVDDDLGERLTRICAAISLHGARAAALDEAEAAQRRSVDSHAVAYITPGLSPAFDPRHATARARITHVNAHDRMETHVVSSRRDFVIGPSMPGRTDPDILTQSDAATLTISYKHVLNCFAVSFGDVKKLMPSNCYVIHMLRSDSDGTAWPHTLIFERLRLDGEAAYAADERYDCIHTIDLISL